MLGWNRPVAREPSRELLGCFQTWKSAICSPQPLVLQETRENMLGTKTYIFHSHRSCNRAEIVTPSTSQPPAPTHVPKVARQQVTERGVHAMGGGRLHGTPSVGADARSWAGTALRPCLRDGPGLLPLMAWLGQPLPPPCGPAQNPWCSAPKARGLTSFLCGLGLLWGFPWHLPGSTSDGPTAGPGETEARLLRELLRDAVRS